MSLFQKSVVTKYLQAQNKPRLIDRWDAFKKHFQNPLIQENIRGSKEEQYQGEFIIDLFVNVFGYTKNPNPNFNITTEYKNVKDSKKADGAIIIDGNVKAVVELKGTKTTDLNKVEEQAFGYKNNQHDCVYVITSNFEKLRLYVDNATEFIEFNLFTLAQQDFDLMYLCLAFENLSNGLAKMIKEESLSKENDITKKLYSDYALFKRELYQDLVTANPDIDPLILFKKSQKLLDRFLFLFFAEDRQLLPPNSVRLILADWKDLQERDEDIRLYKRFKKYFEYLNTGFTGKRYNVFPYNGGLFKTDEILDNIEIDDELLYKHTLKLSEYDFQSEVDVNILGHIFENSLNDIDEIKSQIEGTIIDKAKTKRKKDGVFYTPKYITKYIVDNTIGKLCLEKKEQLNIVDEDYILDKKRQKKTIQALIFKLKDYRDWLLHLTICDPACGSGAFLNQALDFLIREHRYIDELQSKLFGDALILSDFEKSILENNLFGVDLNEESVEIAKLSLWLRTARPNRKLNDLNNNIKCGNSLSADTNVVGEKSFNWQDSFPQIFEKGGFDVIIGNPPYVKEATNKAAFEGLHKHPGYQGKMDLWYLFGWLAIDIVKNNNGLIGFIAPNNWITNDGASNFRNQLLKEAKLIEFIDFGDFKIFENAGIQTMIYIMSKNIENENYKFQYSKIIEKNVNNEDIQLFLSKSVSNKFEIYQASISRDASINSTLNFPNETNKQILEKLELEGNFKFQPEEINSGIDIGQDFVNSKSQSILGENFEIGDGVFNLSLQEYDRYNFTNEEKSLIKPFFTPREISRYLTINKNNYWVIYTSSKFKNLEEIKPYPNIKNHLDKFSRIITSDNKPYGLHRTRNEKIFIGEKILSIRKCSAPSFSYVDFDTYVNRSYNIIQTSRVNLKYLTSLLNSKLIKFWLKEKGKLQGDLFQIDITPLLSIPIKTISEIEQKPFVELVDCLLVLNNQIHEQTSKFLRSVKRKLAVEELPRKFYEWYNLNYSEFIKELLKSNIKLSIKDEAEWEEYFLQESKNALEIKSKIDRMERSIDSMIYKLYNINEQEISLVEK